MSSISLRHCQIYHSVIVTYITPSESSILLLQCQVYHSISVTYITSSLSSISLQQHQLYHTFSVKYIIPLMTNMSLHQFQVLTMSVSSISVRQCPVYNSVSVKYITPSGSVAQGTLHYTVSPWSKTTTLISRRKKIIVDKTIELSNSIRILGLNLSVKIPSLLFNSYCSRIRSNQKLLNRRLFKITCCQTNK